MTVSATPDRERASDNDADNAAVPGPRTDSGELSGRSAAEWVTLALSSLIVLGLVAVTSYLYLTASTAPAAVEIEPHLDELYAAGNRFYVPVTVRNTGGLTAEDVRVRMTLTDGSEGTETAELMVQFLAGGGSSRATVSFGSDPRLGQLTAVVVSFLKP